MPKSSDFTTLSTYMTIEKAATAREPDSRSSTVLRIIIRTEPEIFEKNSELPLARMLATIRSGSRPC